MPPSNSGPARQNTSASTSPVRATGRRSDTGQPIAVKIVATLGPATNTDERVEALLSKGARVFRINFSHATQDEARAHIERVRRAGLKLDTHVAVLQDLQGPRIRVGDLVHGGPIDLKTGQVVTLTGRPVMGAGDLIPVTYEKLARDVAVGQRVLLDDGRLVLRIEAVDPPDVRCTVLEGGPLKPHKGVNVPEAKFNVPVLSEKDLTDLHFGITEGVDYIALSFVRQPEDADPVRDVLNARRAEIPVIAKVEKPEALANLPEVMDSFDGVMVARGDLGVELPPEEVPVWQKRIIALANRVGKPVITATQMLESMVRDLLPTRAELSDVANAALDGSDAVMLSAETSIGEYPVEAVEMMARIVRQAQQYERQHPRREPHEMGRAQVIAHAACGLARDLDAQAMVVFTQTGLTAQLVSQDRPPMPIYAFTEQPGIARRLALWWGVEPRVVSLPDSTDDAILMAERRLLEREGLERGDRIVVVGSSPVVARGRTNFFSVHRLGQRWNTPGLGEEAST